MIAEYRRTLKMPEAEEVFDLLFYRPLGYLFVALIRRTPITPNQVTMLSGAAGIVAGWMFSAGTPAAAALGALWYAIANVLDCADGQLARLQNSGSPLGRLVDGIADYVSTIAIFVGIGLGNGGPWSLVISAGMSSAIHALLFDHYQSEFIAIVRSEQVPSNHETDRYVQEVRMLRKEGRKRIRAAILSLYMRYAQLQRVLSTGSGIDRFGPEEYRARNAVMIRAWSLLGPTTNRTLLIICALADRLGLYLQIVVVGGNALAILLYVAQWRIHRRMRQASRVHATTIVER